MTLNETWFTQFPNPNHQTQSHYIQCSAFSFLQNTPADQHWGYKSHKYWWNCRLEKKEQLDQSGPPCFWGSELVIMLPQKTTPTHVTRWPCWLVNTIEFFSRRIYMKIEFSSQRRKVLSWGRGGGGGSTYERGEDTCRKFWIKPLKETDLGQAFLIPKRGHVKTQTNEKTWIIWME